MIVFALSSAPCFELFSAAPTENNLKQFQTDFWTLLSQIQSLTHFNFNNFDRESRPRILHYASWQKNRTCWKYGKFPSPASPNGDLPAEAISSYSLLHMGAALALKFKSSFWIFHLHSRMHQNLTRGLHLLCFRGPQISTYNLNPRSKLNLGNGFTILGKKILGFFFSFTHLHYGLKCN